MHQDKTMVPVVKGLVLYRRKMLLLRRSLRDEVDPGKWETGGGKIEFGETIQQALHREIWEETGIAAQVGELLYATTYFPNPNRQLFILTYACAATSNVVCLSEEHIDYRWAGRQEVIDRIDSGILGDLLENKIFDRLTIAD